LAVATGLPKLLGSGLAHAIGWIAKQTGSDPDKVDATVKSFEDYLNQSQV